MTQEELKKKQEDEQKAKAKSLFDFVAKINPFTPSVDKASKKQIEEVEDSEQLVDRMGNPIPRKRKP